MKVCPFCHTTIEEIKQTGFVGCAQCYSMPEVRELVRSAFGNRVHKGGKHGSL